VIEFLFVALFQTVSGTPAEAVPTPAPARQAGQPAPQHPVTEDEDRLICRNEPVIGSRFTRRVCLTKKEREMLEAEARGLLEDSMRINDSQGN
jgi:hypothetical protein